LALALGKNVLERIITDIASGLLQRYDSNPGVPLDIILAENTRSTDDFAREQLITNPPSDFSLDTLVGLAETSIGKMVPIILQTELDRIHW
jgi:mannitol-1-phosphate 5-dehydrogenase